MRRDNSSTDCQFGIVFSPTQMKGLSNMMRHVMSRIGAGGDQAENADKKKNIEYVIVIDKGGNDE